MKYYAAEETQTNTPYVCCTGALNPTHGDWNATATTYICTCERPNRSRWPVPIVAGQYFCQRPASSRKRPKQPNEPVQCLPPLHCRVVVRVRRVRVHRWPVTVASELPDTRKKEEDESAVGSTSVVRAPIKNSFGPFLRRQFAHQESVRDGHLFATHVSTVHSIAVR